MTCPGSHSLSVALVRIGILGPLGLSPQLQLLLLLFSHAWNLAAQISSSLWAPTGQRP